VNSVSEMTYIVSSVM